MIDIDHRSKRETFDKIFQFLFNPFKPPIMADPLNDFTWSERDARLLGVQFPRMDIKDQRFPLVDQPLDRAEINSIGNEPEIYPA